jgi:hypothetical protein
MISSCARDCSPVWNTIRSRVRRGHPRSP